MNIVKKWLKRWIAETFLHDEIAALNESLAQARGALSEVSTIVTSCVPVDVCADNQPKDQEGYEFPMSVPEHQELHKIAEAVLNRILCSGDTNRSGPTWYRFPWEEKLWKAYNADLIGACASETSSRKLGTKLSNTAWLINHINFDDEQPVKSAPLHRQPLFRCPV